jgi:carbamoyl-phosphate synthase large subunit
VVKERYGAGSQNIGLNLTKQEALHHSAKLSEPIFQPFISGKELSVDLYVSKKGKVKGVVCRSRDVVVNGESQITTTVESPKLEKLAIKVAEKLKLCGHIVLQVLIDSKNKIHIIECNSRFGGASTLSIQCGLDSFYWAMLEASGHDIDDYPFIKQRESRMQIRFPEDIVIHGAGI